MDNVEKALKLFSIDAEATESVTRQEVADSVALLLEEQRRHQSSKYCQAIQQGRQLLRMHDNTILYVKDGSNHWKSINDDTFSIETLTELYLGTLGRSPQVLVDAVAKILRHPKCCLGKLNLQNNQLGDAHVESLAGALQQQATLFQLVLSFNSIADAGGISLARLLHQQNTCIRQLDARFNRMGNPCAKYFARVLRDSHTVALLDLRGNPLSVESEDILVHSASRNYSLVTLGLPIGGLQAQAVLQRNRALFERNYGMCPAQVEDLVRRQTTECNLHSVPLSQFPRELPRSITVLVLRSTGLTALPATVDQLSFLRELDVSYNRLEQLPDISSLTQLVLLDARYNNLQTLTPSVGELDLLQYLYLRFNPNLNFLPSQLHNCFSLEVLDLEGCPLNTLPSSVLGSLRNEGRVMIGTELAELMTYLRALGSGQAVTMARVKLMVCGEEGVGKTTLVATLRNAPKPEALATDGVDISKLTIPTTRQHRSLVDVPEIQFDCWDYAGQQLYYSTHQFFLSPEAIYLICFRATTFSPERVEYWLKNIRLHAPNAPILLVATHCDLQSTQHLEQLDARFSSIGQVFRVSGTKGDGVAGLRDKIIAEAISADLVGKLLPRSWIDLEAWVLTARLSGLQPWMEFSHFTAVAEGTNVSSDDIGGAVDYLHKTGVVLHFANDDHLKKWIFLAPQFIADVMSCIITLKHRLVKQGKLSVSQLPFAWASFPPEIHSVLLALLLTFEVVFELPGGDELLVPALLPEKQGRGSSVECYDAEWCTYGRIYIFRFMPLGFFARVITRILGSPGVRLRSVWADELFVDFGSSVGGAQAVILYDPLSCRLSIRAKDRSDGELLRCVVSAVEDLLEGWYPRADYTVLIPCTHCLKEGHPRSFRFSLNVVVDAIHRGDNFVRCRNVEPVKIQSVAPDLAMNYMRRKVVNWSELEIGEGLGEGSSASVRKAKWRNHLVAVKLVEESAAGDLVITLKDFNAEVFALSSLSHPNIVSLFAICLSPLASILEYVEFGSLWDSFQDGTLLQFPQGWQRAVLIDVARGMSALHGLRPPVIHRDLRSPNVLISSLDPLEIKIGDLGLARQVRDTGGVRGGLLQMNSMWTAPEVLQGQPYGTPCDVYSFAMVAWECVWADARIPFAEFDQEFHGKPPQFLRDSISSGLRPSLPATDNLNLLSLINDCWVTDASKRPRFRQISVSLGDQMPQKPISLSSIQSEMFFVSPPSGEETNSPMRSDPCVTHYRQRLSPKLGAIHSMCRVPDSGQLWCGDARGSLTVWSVADRKCLCRYLAHEGPVSALCCGPAGSGAIISAGEDGKVLRFGPNPDADARHSNVVEAAGLVREGAIFCALWDHNSRCVWTGDSSGRLCCFDDQSLNCTRAVFVDHVSPVFSVQLVDANLWLGVHCEIVVLDMRALIEIRRWRAHAGPVTCFLLDLKRRLCWSSGDDGDLVVHQSETGQIVERRDAHARKTFQMAAVGGDSTAAAAAGCIWSVSADESILAWHQDTRSFMFQIKGLHSCVLAIQVMEEEEEVWTADADGLIVIWSAR